MNENELCSVLQRVSPAEGTLDRISDRAIMKCKVKREKNVSALKRLTVVMALLFTVGIIPIALFLSEFEDRSLYDCLVNLNPDRSDTGIWIVDFLADNWSLLYVCLYVILVATIMFLAIRLAIRLSRPLPRK